MKIRKIVLTLIMSIFLINVAESLVSTKQIRAITNHLMQRTLIFDTFESSSVDTSLILDLAKNNRVNIMYFSTGENALEHEINLFLTSDTILNKLNLNKDLDEDTFNTLPYSLSSKSKQEAYYIDFPNAMVDLTLAPIRDTINQNIYVSSDLNENIDRFIADLNNENIQIIEAFPDIIDDAFPLIRLTLAFILESKILLGFLSIYIVVLIHQQYQSYRHDTILRLQGYLDRNIWFDKVSKSIRVFIFTSGFVATFYTLVFLRNYEHIIAFLKSYFTSIIFVGVVITVVITIMQVLSFRSNHLDSLRGKRRQSYFNMLVILKIIWVPILFSQIIADFSQLQDLLLERNRLSKNAFLNESIYTLENIPGDIDLDYWINNNDLLYNQLSQDLTVLYSNKITDDTFDAAVIYMNNEYFNTLDIIDLDGNPIKTNTDDEILVLSNASQVNLTYQELKKPMLCSFTGFEDCSNVAVYALDNEYSVPIIGNHAEIIKSPYIIITGQIPQVFVDYNFDLKLDSNLENKLEVHLEGTPLRYVNLKEEHTKINQYLQNHLYQLGINLTFVTLLLIFVIVILYRTHYDIYKLFYSNMYMNGNSAYSILAPIFGFQVLINGLASIVVYVLNRKVIYILMLFLYTLVVEVITYVLFTRSLRRNIVRNVKGG